MRPRLKIWLLLAALVLAMLVDLCPVYAVQTSDDITLHVLWAQPNDPSVADLLNKYAQEFTDTNPDINVEILIRRTAEVRQILEDAVGSTDTNSDNNLDAPDISVMPARWVPEFVSLDMIQPLDKYITQMYREQFVSQIINSGAVYQGRTFGLPVGTSTRAMYYNIDLFEQAGITKPPETWDELLAAGKAINVLNRNVYGFGLQGGGGAETNTYFYYFVWGNGGELYNANGTESALARAEAVEALTFLQRMVLENATQPDPTSKAYEVRLNLEDLFQSGKLGMVISGPWLASRLRKNAPDVKFGIAPIPYNKIPATYGVMDALVILNTSKHKDEAWKFMQFLYNTKRRLEYSSRNGVLPELIAVAESRDFTENEDFAVFLELLPNARFEPLHIQSEQIAETVIEAIQPVYRNELTPQQALESAAKKIDELLTISVSGW